MTTKEKVGWTLAAVGIMGFAVWALVRISKMKRAGAAAPKAAPSAPAPAATAAASGSAE